MCVAKNCGGNAMTSRPGKRIAGTSTARAEKRQRRDMTCVAEASDCADMRRHRPAEQIQAKA